MYKSIQLIILICTILCINPYNSQAGNWDFCTWDKQDKALEFAWQIANVADIYVTDRIIEQGGQELNPLIPKYPTDDELVAYGIGFAIGHYFISGIMQEFPNAKKYWFWGSFAFKGGAVVWNVFQVDW